MKRSSFLIYHWYLLLSASLHQSSALDGQRHPFHRVLLWCLLLFLKGFLAFLFPSHPAQCWEQSEISRAQGRGKQPWCPVTRCLRYTSPPGMFTQGPVWHHSSSSQGSALPDVGGDKSSAQGQHSHFLPHIPLGTEDQGSRHWSLLCTSSLWLLAHNFTWVLPWSPGHCWTWVKADSR